LDARGRPYLAGINLSVKISDSAALEISLTMNSTENSIITIHRFTSAGVLLIMVVFAIGCGSSKEEQANRAILGPLAERHVNLMADVGEWARNEKNRSDTYGDELGKLTDWGKEEDSVQSQLRGVVPTSKFECLVNVLRRSISTESGLLAAEKNFVNHTMLANGASQSGKRESNLELYSAAVESYRESAREYAQASEARQGSARSAKTSAALADSLRALIRQTKLIPSVPQISFPVLDSAKADSFIIAKNDSLQVTCN
jgi:hypothetical protein